MRKIQRATGNKKKGPAIRQLVLEALRLRERRKINRQVLAGEGTVAWPDLETYT